MKQRAKPGASDGAVVGLDGHVEAFLETLAATRYSRTTRDEKARCLRKLIRWGSKRKLHATDLNDSSVTAFLKSRARAPHKRRPSDRATVRQFLKYLQRRGVVGAARARSKSPHDALIDRYLDHLRHARGLSLHSVAVYAPLVRDFVATCDLSTTSCRRRLNAAVVREHLLARSRGRSSEWTRLLSVALRSFLRFLFLHEAIDVDLSAAVPPVRRWQLAAVPGFLAAEDVERVLAATDRSTEAGRRDLAILLLLARLGFRPGEVVKLELDDVRWRTGEVTVRGKGQFHEQLPLSEEVGAALANYIRHARGTSASRRVFLRLHAPRVGLGGPAAVCSVARAALRRARLQPSGRLGAHIFRHSLATRMIRHGASLAEIAQVLRHRSPVTTQIYAKVEFEALRGVALPWPVANGGAQ